MKKMILIPACAAVAAFTGCKNIEVERHASSVATVKTADGTVEVVRDAANNPVVLDGGWNVDYFQHWNWQKFDSLSAKAGENVSLDINNYSSGSDTNLALLVSTSMDGATKLVTSIGEAYVKVAGGGAQADTALTVAQKVYSYFTSKGGDATAATVTTSANAVTVTDGTTSVSCDASGNCTDCQLSK